MPTSLPGTAPGPRILPVPGTAPEISVVIPTFRRPAELRQALESVAAQGGVHVEVIVVDDCPDGSARAVATAFPPELVRYLVNPSPSRGRPALVRNLGAAQATGELIHFLDDDDLVPDGYYAHVRDLFGASPGLDVVFGRIEPFGRDPAAVSEEAAYFAAAARRAGRCGRLGRWGLAAAMLFRPTLLVCGAAILRRSCWPALQGFDARLPLMEDVDFYMRAIRARGARFVDRLALRYRIGPSLMHRAERPRGLIADSYRHMHRRYRGEHGLLEFWLLKLMAKAIRA